MKLQIIINISNTLQFDGIFMIDNEHFEKILKI